MKDNLEENLRGLVVLKRSISQGLETYVHSLSQDQVLVYDMESKGVRFFQTAYGMEEEPLICNPKRTGIVHDWKNFLSKPNLYNPSWK